MPSHTVKHRPRHAHFRWHAPLAARLLLAVPALLAALTLLTAAPAAAQPFQILNDPDGDGTTNPFTGVVSSSSDWGDYDTDGDLDLVVTGVFVQNGSTLSSATIYENQGGGTFAALTSANLTGVFSGSSAWGDYDNDGDLDLVVTGTTDGTSSGATATIYENQGGGTFAPLGAGLTGVSSGSSEWGDYDADGDLDLVVTGTTDGTSSGATVTIYENQGGGTFTDIGTGLTGVERSSSAWGDYDADGDLDLVVTGLDANNNFTATIYTGDGAGGFTPLTSAGLTGVISGSSAWGDYDGDGDLDLVVTGLSQGTGPTATIYENDVANGNGFTDIGAGLTGVEFGSVDWGDYDGDGDLDLVVVGDTNGNNLGGASATIYRNDGGGTFTDIGAGLTGVGEFNISSSSAWGDYDGDGDLDLVVTGRDADANRTATIYRNDGGGTFIDIGAGLTGVEVGSSAWGDFDGDGDLDLVVTGTGRISGDITRTTTIYENVPGTSATVTLALTGGSYAPPAPQPGTSNNPIGRLELSASGAGAALTELTLTLNGTSAQGVEALALWQSSTGTFDTATATPLPDAQTLDPVAPPPATATFSGLGAGVPTGGTFVFLVADLASGAGGTVEPTLAAAADLTLAGATLTNGPGDFPLALSSGATPLPVELTGFTAQASGEAIALTWQTASETNNAGFEIQRQQASGHSPEPTWERISFVEGAGTTDEPQSYRFRDTAPPFADSLVYRLKQIDTDGTEAFSPEVVVRRGPGSEVRFDAPFPNPTRQQATVRYVVPEGEAQPVRLQVYNILGQRVATLVDESKTPGREEIMLDASRWASGTYVLRLQVGGVTKTQRVTVVR